MLIIVVLTLEENKVHAGMKKGPVAEFLLAASDPTILTMFNRFTVKHLNLVKPLSVGKKNRYMCKT